MSRRSDLDHWILRTVRGRSGGLTGHAGRVLAFTVALLVGLGLLATGGSVLHASRLTAAAGPPHVMMLVEENHSYGSIIGNSQLPYLNSLANQYGSATNWWGVNHPSLPNYLSLVSGNEWGGPADTTPQDATYPGPTIVDELSQAGIGWKAYAEDMPKPCDLTDTFSPGNYDVNHNPFMYFDSIRNNPNQCARDVPFTQFQPDLSSGQAPPFMWVTPNTQNDMHGGTYGQADAFAKNAIQAAMSGSWWQPNSFIVVTWDEGAGSSDQIATMVIPYGGAAKQYAGRGNHYGTLRALEELYGVGLLRNSASTGNGAGDLSPLFTGPQPATQTPAPSPTPTPTPAPTASSIPTPSPTPSDSPTPTSTPTLTPTPTPTDSPTSTPNSSGPPQAAQAASFSNGSPAVSMSVTTSQPVKQGDVLVGWFLQYDSPGQVHISDSFGDSWTRFSSAGFDGGFTGDVVLAWTVARQSGAPQVVVGADKATYLEGSLVELQGASAVQPISQGTIASGNGGLASASLSTPVLASDATLAMVNTGGSYGSASPSSGFTLVSADGSAAAAEVLSGGSISGRPVSFSFDQLTDWNLAVATVRGA